MKTYLILPMLVAGGLAYAAGDAGHGLDVTRPAEGSVSQEDGLAAWNRIYEVASHPRCANCHTDDQNLPMWSGKEYGKTRVHGMHIDAGESRIGAETLECSTCHAISARPNTVPHAAPHTGLDWQLAPVEFVWFDRDSPTICQQMRDPERNGGRDGEGLIDHILHDADVHGFIAWGFEPGAGREPAPGSLQEHLDDVVTWTAAGMPCPES